MTDASTIVEIPRLIQNRVYKQVIFTKDGLTIKKLQGFVPDIFLAAENITGFRYGVNWLRGYAFTIGRQYIIQVMDAEKNVISIKLNSFYKIRSAAYLKAWSNIINQLWYNYFVNNLNFYYDLYSIKQDFELSGVVFRPSGIEWDNISLPWNEIALSNYVTYFMIHHKTDLKKTKSRNFKNDWNALVLQELLKRIVKENNS